MNKISKKELISRIRKIKLLLLDIDGILTSGLVNILANGSEIYTFNVYDGYGIKLWQRAGFKTGFMTGRGAEAIRHRAKKLGVNFLFQNSGDKLEICEKLAKRERISLKEIAFVGDDLQDLSLLKKVGLAISVPNARKEVLSHAHYVSKLKGGEGAVREIIEFLLKAKGLWDNIITQDRIYS